MTDFGNRLYSALGSVGNALTGAIDFAGKQVALPYLRAQADLIDRAGQGPLLSVGDGGKLEGRLPDLAELMTGGMAGPVPGGALGAGPTMRPIRLYHGTLSGDIGDAFKPYTHFGSKSAANKALFGRLTGIRDFLDDPEGLAKFYPEYPNITPAIYPIDLNPKRIFNVPDMMDEWDRLGIMLAMQGNSKFNSYDKSINPFDYIKNLGYDSLRYLNEAEGGVSYIALDPSIVSLLPDSKILPKGLANINQAPKQAELLKTYLKEIPYWK